LRRSVDGLLSAEYEKKDPPELLSGGSLQRGCHQKKELLFLMGLIESRRIDLLMIARLDLLNLLWMSFSMRNGFRSCNAGAIRISF
jgi:hypothetical protein